VKEAAATDRPIAAPARAHAEAIFVLLDFMESSPLLTGLRAIEMKLKRARRPRHAAARATDRLSDNATQLLLDRGPLDLGPMDRAQKAFGTSVLRLSHIDRLIDRFCWRGRD
jgi:hypothetical protein